jgi:NADPH:quinone reductase-like Zn-dependent oxidoreductase
MANKGLLKIGKNQSLLTTIPIPILRDEDVLVRTKAVALNPADWQNLDEDFPEDSKPMLQGHDAAGIIEAVGKSVSQRLKVGDRVLFGCHGGSFSNSLYP